MKKDSLKKDRAVAIIGMGGLFPGAMDIKDYWRLLSRGEDAITEVPDTHWSAEDYYNEDTKAGDYTYCKRGGFLPAIPYDPTEFGIPPNILEATDTSQLLALVATRMALEDAGYGPGGKPWNRDRTGVVLGATGTQELVIPLASRLGFPLWKKALEDAGVPEDQAGDVVARLSDAYVQWQENSFPGLLGNVIAGRIANRFDLGGTNCVVDAACASSLSAINLAALELLSGKCDMMITGGVDTLNDIFMHMCFAKTSVLSFTGDAKPFSKDADGTVLGEGLGIVILKRLSDAEADGDKIYAVIRGVGTSSDGKSAGIYAPVAEGQLKALKQAYEEADVPPDTVELIEAHGTGTRVGDAVEFEALATFFRDAGAEPGNRCAIGSVKSMIGHTKAAAGAASLIKASLALHHKAILPTIKVDEPDPKLKIDETPFYISTTLRPWFSDARHPRRAGVSSFGFGGSNFHMVLEEYVPEKRDVAWDGTVEIAAFSGSTKSDVNEQLKKFADDVSSHKGKPGGVFRAVREEAAKTREKFSHKTLHRLLLVIRRDDDIAAIFKDAVDALNGSGNPAGKAVFYDVSEDSHGKTAFLFPGQGSQYPYMGRDLVVTFPEAHHTFEIANIQFSRLASRPGTRLTDFVFPAGYTKKDRKAAEELLRSTDIAQPAIGALSLGMARILERFNIGADMMCGHSFGELSALRGAGWMDDETFLALASARGKYMAAAGKEKGAMMAVKAKLADIEKFLLENDLDLVLANRNSYEQGVLSGREDEIDRALELCKQNKLRATKLTVSAAFHTGLVQDAAKPFKDYLRKKNITTGKIKVFSNVTAEAYPDDPAGVKKILGSQILNPVNFVEEIENMYADGARVYVEVGPKSVLTGLVKSILKGRDFHAIAMDGSAGRSSGIADLAAVLCFLASRGYPVDLAGWETRPVAEPRKQKMSIPICGANYRKEKPARPKRRIAAKPQPAADGPDTNPAKPSATSESSMRSQTPVSGVRPDSSMVKDALAMVSESLKSMQALQQQTADAHRKFLETQTEAGRALAAVLEKTRNISETILGKAEPGAARIPQTVSPEPVAPPPVSEPSAGDVGKGTKPEAIKTAPPAGVKPGASGVSQEQIESAMLDIVSRVTGYPVDMLGLEMDIENDLGIDSIKRVEILSVFEEEHPDIPSAAPEDLAEMRTLKEICDHLVSLSGAGLSCADSTAKTGKTPQPEGEDTDVPRRVIRIDSSPVAIGKPLEPDKDRTVFLYASDTRWGEDIASALGDLGIKTAIIKDPSSDVDFSTATGLVLLGSFARHDNVLWHVEDETIIKQVFSLVQRAAPFLKQAARQGRDAVFAAVTSLDGEMGFGKSKSFNPIQGALAGLAKTAAIEWEGVKCRHIDVDPSWIGSPDCSSAVAREILNSDGPLETGLCDGARKTLCLVEEKCPDGELLLGPGDVVMVSGGARGVTARCMIALAEKTRPVLVILGRSPLPSKEPDWLSGVTDDSEIKKRIIANEFAEKSATPAEVDRHFKRYMANREVEENLARLKELCTDVVYHSVDVRDAKAVAGICESVKKTFGPVRCLVHGAGVLEDKLIEEKTPEQFERVFDTKVAGARALLSALDMDELRYLVFFSSVSARMGNKGQVDYAMANEVLNKTAQQLAMQYGSCRVISFNWGPWDGGMVTPALKREFKKNNVPLIPLGAGSRRMVAEMAGTSEDVEVVIGAGFHDTEADAVTLSGSTVAGQSDVSPPKASLKKKDALFPAFTLKLDIDSCPILSHHILNGKPVVPFALALEWLGNGALHANPGLLLTGFEDMRVLSGIRLDNDSKGLKVMVGKPVRKDSAFEIDVQLHDSDPENRRVYYAAKAVLSSGYDSPPVFSAPPALFEKNYKKGVDELYGPVLFHGTALHGIKDVASCSKEGIKVFVSGAPSPRNWIKQPVRNTWLADPLVIDSAFQAAIVWCHENAGMVSLPVGFRSFRQYRPSFQKEGTVIVLEIKEQSGRKIKGDVTFLDSNNEKEVVARMLGYEAIMDKSLEAAFKS